MTKAKLASIKATITNILSKNAGIAPSRVRTLLPIKSLQGKLYEVSVLAAICENLVTKEGYTISLVGGSNLMLKQKGSPINRSFPYFQIFQKGKLFAELFTDTYFSTISFETKRTAKPTERGDFHELDIALVKPTLSGIPAYKDVIIAVECKNTRIKKHIIRELLGFRRELSFFLPKHRKTPFINWPTARIRSNPNSIHMLYCSDNDVTLYGSNCEQFGIIIQHYKM